MQLFKPVCHSEFVNKQFCHRSKILNKVLTLLELRMRVQQTYSSGLENISNEYKKLGQSQSELSKLVELLASVHHNSLLQNQLFTQSVTQQVIKEFKDYISIFQEKRLGYERSQELLDKTLKSRKLSVTKLNEELLLLQKEAKDCRIALIYSKLIKEEPAERFQAKQVKASMTAQRLQKKVQQLKQMQQSLYKYYEQYKRQHLQQAQFLRRDIEESFGRLRDCIMSLFVHETSRHNNLSYDVNRLAQSVNSYQSKYQCFMLVNRVQQMKVQSPRLKQPKFQIFKLAQNEQKIKFIEEIQLAVQKLQIIQLHQNEELTLALGLLVPVWRGEEPELQVNQAYCLKVKDQNFRNCFNQVFKEFRNCKLQVLPQVSTIKVSDILWRYLQACEQEQDSLSVLRIILLLFTYYYEIEEQDFQRKKFNLFNLLKGHSIWMQEEFWITMICQSIFNELALKEKQDNSHNDIAKNQLFMFSQYLKELCGCQSTRKKIIVRASKALQCQRYQGKLLKQAGIGFLTKWL